jgi:penicillin amidase
LPQYSGEAQLPGLSERVTVERDDLGIPLIRAASRRDAIRALGFVTAQERLFQMELMRRKAAGRLSEVFGSAALNLDIRQRRLGFQRTAAQIFDRLSRADQDLLEDYAGGVNAYLSEMPARPPEFLLVRHTPEPWSATDSLLVLLVMFQTLDRSEADERMMTIMRDTLPSEVFDFLTPDVDEWPLPLIGGSAPRRPARPVPVAALAALKSAANAPRSPGPDVTLVQGSNAWAVGASRTRDGRAILANDMHLDLGVPNIWYRAALEYGDTKVAGLVLPGVPGIVAGSGPHVAWGFTVSCADVADLVRLEMNAENPGQYRTPQGWRNFERVAEVVKVKGEDDVTVEVRSTIWGPVVDDLLGKPVALRWTALDPTAVDLEMLRMAEARTAAEAVEIAARAGTPPLNAVIADDTGHIAWTLSGKLPLRHGVDGVTAQQWSVEGIGWERYLAGAETPRVIDPESGILVNANNRSVGPAFPQFIGTHFALGYRAHRIHDLLTNGKNLTEADMLRAQLDIRAGVEDFYRNLALELLTPEITAADRNLLEARKLVESWDGQAGRDNPAFALLETFHHRLMDEVIDPFLGSSSKADPAFAYVWHTAETPLRAILTARPPALVPDRSPQWSTYLLAQLRLAIAEAPARRRSLNEVRIRHPLSAAAPLVGRLFDMPQQNLDGCKLCVRVISGAFGASVRMVISPGASRDGILHMPTGESGHPLSPHYGDQQEAWASGRPLPFLPGPARQTLVLEPRSAIEPTR